MHQTHPKWAALTKNMGCSQLIPINRAPPPIIYSKEDRIADSGNPPFLQKGRKLSPPTPIRKSNLLFSARKAKIMTPERGYLHQVIMFKNYCKLGRTARNPHAKESLPPLK